MKINMQLTGTNVLPNDEVVRRMENFSEGWQVIDLRVGICVYAGTLGACKDMLSRVTNSARRNVLKLSHRYSGERIYFDM